jgi:hypothetical protein
MESETKKIIVGYNAGNQPITIEDVKNSKGLAFDSITAWTEPGRAAYSVYAKMSEQYVNTVAKSIASNL